MQKQIPLGDVLSITTGSLVSRDHIDGVYHICDYMTGRSNMTHELPYVCKPVKQEILKQHPQLESITVPAWDFQKPIDDLKKDIFTWLEEMERQYGSKILLTPIQG